MIAKLLEQFTFVLDGYKVLIEENKKLKELYVSNNVEGIGEQNKKIMLTYFDLNNNQKKLKDVISGINANNGILSSKVKDIYPHISTKEVDELKAQINCAFRYEKELKNITIEVKCQAEGKNEVANMMMDAIGKVAQEEKKSGNVFINRKF